MARLGWKGSSRRTVEGSVEGDEGIVGGGGASILLGMEDCLWG